MDKELETIADNLTLKQEQFCRYYTQRSELFGNGTLAFAKAYGYDLDSADRERAVDEKGLDIPGTSEYDRMNLVCRSSASRLLTNDIIIKRTTQLLNEQMNDEVIDARLTEIIVKGEDKDSIAAIKEYNKLKQRITEKSEIKHSGTISGFNFIRNNELNDESNNSDNKTD